MPTSTISFAGLEFTTTGTLTDTNHVVASSNPMQVGVTPKPGSSFVPLLQLDGGVSFMDNDATGTFTTTGTVSGLVGGDTRQLLDAQKHTFTGPGLLGSNYFKLAASDTNMPHLTVGGGQLAVSALHLAPTELDLQGTIDISTVSGLTVAVQGSDHVVLSANGLSIAGPDPTVTGPDTFTRDGVTLSVSNLDVHVDPATNALDISGMGSVTIGGNTLTLTLGNTATPGLVIQNGDIVSLLATVTPPKGSADTPFKVGGMMFALNSATFSFDQAAGTFGIGAGATVTLDGHAVDIKLGSARAPGIVVGANGQLASLDGSITTDLEIGGVTIKAEDLSVHYVPGADLAITGAASFMFDSQKIELALGSTGADGTRHPGIDIDPSTGNIKSLDAAISTDIEIGAVAFKADALGIHYAPGGDFFITGKAEFDLKDSNSSSMPDQMIALQLGSDGHSGIDIDPNGNLKGLNAAVTTDISVAGLEIKTDGLGIEWQRSSPNSVTIYGGASFTLKDQSVGIMLGDMDHPGLVISDGQLTTLSASVTADISLLGIHLSANGLTVAYTAPMNGNPEMFDLYGDVAVTTSFLTFDSSLGTASSPGLEIIGGQLTQLNITVNGGFALFGFNVAANDLSVRYNAALSSLELSGGLTVQFTDTFQASAKILKGGLLINTATGALAIDTSNGLELQASAVFGSYGVPNLDISFSNGPGGVNFSAMGELDLPDNIKVVLDKLDIVNGQLADVGLTVNAPIPIGDTGFYIDSFSGELDNLNNPSALTVKAGATISFGGAIPVPSIPGIFTAPPEGVFLVDATGSITVTPTDLKLQGSVNLLGGLLGHGQATLDLNWATGVYSVSGSFGMFDNIVTFSGSLDITNHGDITLQATASVNVPPQVPFIGGDSLGNLNFVLQFHPGDWTGSYIAAWTSVNLFVTSFTFGFKIDFTGQFNLLNGNDVNAIVQQADVTLAQQQDVPTTYACSYNISDPNAAGAQVTLNTLDFFDAVYGTGIYYDGTLNSYGEGANTTITYTYYQLSHSYAIVPTLGFDVYNSFGTNVGHVSFDQAGNFLFTPTGNAALVPTGAIVATNGMVTLLWKGDPGASTALANVVYQANAHYHASGNYTTANAVIEVLQNTSGGTPVVVDTYAIDPLGQGLLSASAEGALYSDTISNPWLALTGNTWSTTYTLPHGNPDLKTLSFSVRNGGTLLGTCSVDSFGGIHFTRKAGTTLAPTSGIVHENVIVLDWSTNPGSATAVTAMYRSVDDRVINIDFNRDVARDGTGLRGQYTVEVVTYQPLVNAPTFSETTHYQLPTVAFPQGQPVLKNGVLGGQVDAASYVPGAAQGGPQGSLQDTKVSLYYTQTDSTANGTLIQTLDYGAFTNNGPNTLATGGFTWTGFQNLPAGQYYVYAVINDGQNPPQYSAVTGPFTSTGPTPVLSVPAFVALTPNGAGSEQGAFSAAANTALGVSMGFTTPVTINATVKGGSFIFPAGSIATQFPFNYPSSAAATADLNGLQFVADGTFDNAATATFTATTNINGITYTAIKTVPLVTPNTHLVISQAITSPAPADPDSVYLTITAANPGGPDGQDGTDVQVQEYLTPGMRITAATAPAGTSFDLATGLWTIGSLPIGAPAATLTLTLKADPGTSNTPLTATAHGTSALFNYPGSDAASAVSVVPASHALVFPPQTLASTAVGAPAEWQLTADRGGGGPYTFAVAPGANLPPGMFLQKNGFLSGVPTTAGHYSFAVVATSPSGVSAAATLQLSIAGAPIATAGQSYTYTLGEGADQFYTATPGSTLPPRLAISYSNGNYVLTGSPAAAGLYSFSVRANSFYFGAYQDFPLTLFVDGPITISPMSLPNAAVGSPYLQTVSATGGSGGFAYGLQSGTLPTGLVVNMDGSISGTIASTVTPGTYAFSVYAYDASGSYSVQTYSLQVAPAIATSPSALPPATVNSPYSVTLSATGGSGSGYTFALTAGTLPAGLTLAPGGLISGTIPAGTLPVDQAVTITITDSNGTTAAQSYTLNVNPAVTITPADLPDAAAGTDYSVTLSAIGGSGTGYTFALTGGTLPAGLSLASAGTLSGSVDSAAAAGYYGFTVAATDSQGAIGTVTCRLFVDAALTVPTPKIPAATVGVPYSQQLTANGGSGIYTFAISAGTLPAGLTLGTGGLLSGTIPGTTPAGTYSFTITVSDSLGTGCTCPVTLTVAAANVTWTGAVSTAWSNPANWSSHSVPGVGDNVTVPSHPTAGRCPVLDVTAMVNNLILQTAATLTLSGHALTVDGTLTNLGNVILRGDEAVTLANGNDTREGTWTYVGDGTGGTLAIPSLGYFNLTINDNHPHHDTFATASALNIAGTLTVACGTFVPTSDVTACGVALSGTGSLNAPAVLNDSGNWVVTGGTFRPNGGTVFLTGTGTTLLTSGNRAFANLTHSGSGAVSLAGTPLTVGGTFTDAAGAGNFRTNDLAVTITGPAELNGGAFIDGTGVVRFNGGLTLAGGSFLGATGAVTTAGIDLTAGSLTAPTSTLIDTGDWKVTGGTFYANHGSVVLAGSNQHVSGNTTFFNLTKVTTAADTLTFQAGATQTVNGRLTLRGALAGKRLALRSSVAGSTWSIVPNAAAVVSFVDVQDSTNLRKKSLVATGSHNSGDDIGWRFV